MFGNLKECGTPKRQSKYRTVPWTQSSALFNTIQNSKEQSGLM